MTTTIATHCCSSEAKSKALELQKAWLTQAALRKGKNALAAAQKAGEKAHNAVITAMERSARKGELDHRTEPYRQNDDPVWVALRPFLSRQGAERQELVETTIGIISDEADYREAAERAKTSENRERLIAQAEQERGRALGLITAWTAEIDAEEFRQHPPTGRTRPKGLDRKKITQLAATARQEIRRSGAAQRQAEMLDEEDPFPVTGTEDQEALYAAENPDEWDEENEGEEDPDNHEDSSPDAYNGLENKDPKHTTASADPKAPR